MKKIRIGGGQGFWGDSNDAAIHMVRQGNIQYLACDYLAELSLSILQRMRLRNPSLGYTKDFIDLLKIILPEALEKKIRIMANAGGMNVPGAVEAVADVARKAGVKCKIGYVLGDDLLGQVDSLRAQGVDFANMDSGESFDSIKDKVVNVNVYYGHQPARKALEMGADVVVTGRATDSSLFLSPLAHEFNWDAANWEQMALGVLAGHMLECGGQGAGGNYDYDWRSVPDMDNLGFPIAEVDENLGIAITKVAECGGLITTQSCKEQLLYEIHDPSRYLTPDVIADFSHITMEREGKDRVRLKGVKGTAPSDMLKLNIGYHAGYKIEAYLPYTWPDAYEKAQKAAEIIEKRMARKGITGIRFDYLGVNALHGSLAPKPKEEPNEVVLRICLKTKEKSDALKLAPEIAPLILNGPPGACFFGGRATPTEIIALWPTFVPKDAVKLTTHIKEIN